MHARNKAWERERRKEEGREESKTVRAHKRGGRDSQKRGLREGLDAQNEARLSIA